MKIVYFLSVLVFILIIVLIHPVIEGLQRCIPKSTSGYTTFTNSEDCNKYFSTISGGQYYIFIDSIDNYNNALLKLHSYDEDSEGLYTQDSTWDWPPISEKPRFKVILISPSGGMVTMSKNGYKFNQNDAKNNIIKCIRTRFSNSPLEMNRVYVVKATLKKEQNQQLNESPYNFTLVPQPEKYLSPQCTS